MFTTWALTALSLLGASAGKGGLEAVAVSRDGKLVAVGGQSRAAYVLDAVTLEVKVRISLRARIGGLAFAPDGKSLLVEDEMDTLTRIDLETRKELARVTDVSGLTSSPGGGLLAVRGLSPSDRPSVRFLNFALEEVGRCTLAEKASAFAFSADGKHLTVLESSHLGEEKRLPLADTPPELKGLARQAFQQQNDGRSAWLRVFTAPSGKEVERFLSWYTSDSDSTVLGPAGEGVWIVNRGSVAAWAHPKKGITLEDLGERGPHAIHFSADGKALWLGGRAGGGFGPVGKRREPFSLDELPGQGEYVNRFATHGDVVFGVTSAFRAFRVEKGSVKAAAVY
jgi:hypothetical protein